MSSKKSYIYTIQQIEILLRDTFSVKNPYIIESRVLSNYKKKMLGKICDGDPIPDKYKETYSKLLPFLPKILDEHVGCREGEFFKASFNTLLSCFEEMDKLSLECWGLLKLKKTILIKELRYCALMKSEERKNLDLKFFEEITEIKFKHK